MNLSGALRRRTTLIASGLAAIAFAVVGIAITAPAAQAATVQNPVGIAVTAEADTTAFAAGDVITYEVTVRNSGSEPLRSASAFLPVGVTLAACDAAVTVTTSSYTKQTTAKMTNTLQPGDELVCTGTHVATHLEANAGQLVLAFDGAAQVVTGSTSKTPLPKRWYVATPEESTVG